MRSRRTCGRCVDRACHFRRDPHERDPHEIEGAWAQVDGLYTAKDSDKFRSERAFLAAYVERLHRVLAEAVPGVGGLSLAPEW